MAKVYAFSAHRVNGRVGPLNADKLPPMLPTVLLAVVLAGTAAVLFRHSVRSRTLARLRAEWGTPRSPVRNVAAVASVWQSRAAVAGSRSYLDDRTWSDLNLDEVFESVARTESTLGQEALYNRLRSEPTADPLDAFEALVTRMTTDAAARERAQLALSRLQDPHGYDIWRLARANAIEHHGWYIVFPLLAATTVVLGIAALFWHALAPLLIGVLAVNLAVRFSAANAVSAFGASFRQIAPLVTVGQGLDFLNSSDIDPIVGSVRADAARLRGLKTVSRWVSGDPLMLSVTAGATGEVLTAAVNALYEYVSIMLLLDGNAAFLGVRYVHSHADALVRLTAAVGEIDAAISVASLRQERTDWVRPRFASPGTVASIIDVRHPLVAEAIPNSATLEPGRGILITGSNMSGKSTFLRTVGVTVVMAQTLNTCFAAAYDAPVFRVQSCIGRSDDLIAGKSYYLVEVEEVLSRVHASAATSPHLFLFDELFRGTNALERIAAAEAVLRSIVSAPTGRKPHVVLAATHDNELVELLHDVCAPYHFTDSIGPDGLTFDYRLEPGVATSRNAIALLQMQGAPASVVTAALERVTLLERQRAITGGPVRS
jgi:hypothetical protein